MGLMDNPQEFVNRESQSDDISISPNGIGVSSANVPGGNSGVGVPGYPVEVVSTYPVVPLNAKEVEFEFSDPVDSAFAGASGKFGLAHLTYAPPPGYVLVIKKISWNIYPRRWFLSNFGLASLMINGIVNDAVRSVNISDSGKFDLHVIAPLNSIITFNADFTGTYGLIAGTSYGTNSHYSSQCHMRLYGHLLFSRGLPANFEIGS